MSRSEIISIVAVCISLLSLAATIFFNLRDRARLVTSSEFYPWYEGQAASVHISIANAGRRPVVLRMWVGAKGKTEWVGTYLGEKGGGLRLAEHDRHDFELKKSDLLAVTPSEAFMIEDVWYEDNIGRRYKVKNVKSNLAALDAT